MSSASNTDVAMRFAVALADRLLESHDIDVVTSHLQKRLREAPEDEHLLLMDILGALARHADHSEARTTARH